MSKATKDRVAALLAEVEKLPPIERMRFDAEYCSRHSRIFAQLYKHHDNAMSQLEDKIAQPGDDDILRMRREKQSWREIAMALTDANDGTMPERVDQVRKQHRRAKARAGKPIVTQD